MLSIFSAGASPGRRRRSSAWIGRCSWASKRRRSSRLFFGAVLRPAGMKHARLVEPSIGMRAEKVAQALHQVRRSAGAAKPVVVGERGGKRRRRHAGATASGRRCATRPPRGDRVAKMLGEQQVRERVALVGLHDAVETGADDAAGAPDRGDLAEIEVPAVLLAATPSARSPARRRRSWPRRARRGPRRRSRRLRPLRRRSRMREEALARRRAGRAALDSARA